jgi:hypothetical protein
LGSSTNVASTVARRTTETAVVQTPTVVVESTPAPTLETPYAPSSVVTPNTNLNARGNVMNVRLRGGVVDPAVAQLKERVALATDAIRARLHAGGFEPYPLGPPPTGLTEIGGALGVKLAGGSNHALGSLLIVDPTSQQAFHVKHGFAAFALETDARLGGRPRIDALGAPLEDEHAVGPDHAVQRFEHGTLHWTSATSVTVDPADLFDRHAAGTSAIALPTPTAALAAVAKDTYGALLAATWLTPMPYAGEEHAYFFVEWARKQVESNPAVKSVEAKLTALLNADPSARPDRLGAFFEAVRGFARAELTDPRLNAETREHLVNVTALVAMASIALKNNHSNEVRNFPVFMWDGRTCDGGMDKAWHFTNHAMMAYVLRFDAQYGAGTISADFTRAVDDTDKAGVAQRVNTTYHEKQGALGGYVAWVVPGPTDDVAPLYAPPPKGLSADEQRVFDTAVKIGDAHEFKSSGDNIAVTLDDVGDTARRWDPRAELHARFSRVWGLQDHGVARDLTANRLGAQFALELFRDPSSTPSFPYDDGKVSKNGAYAADRPIPFAHVVAEERVMLAALASGTPGSDAQFRAEVARAEKDGKDASVAAARAELESAVDALLAKAGAGDASALDTVARFYGNFSVRTQRFGERLKGYVEDWAYFHPDSPAHEAWARERIGAGAGIEVKGGFMSRFDLLIASGA